MDTQSTRCLSVLELFSGIGGMHFAFLYAGIKSVHVPVDINSVANAVYTTNFPECKDALITNTICNLQLNFFEKKKYDVWTMAPPCQPYTIQTSSKQQDHLDVRANALGHITTILDQMHQDYLPSIIILENVKPFYKSYSWTHLKDILKKRNYIIKSYILSPRQFGFPNERQRFYSISILGTSSFNPLRASYSINNQIKSLEDYHTDDISPCNSCFFIPSIQTFLDPYLESHQYYTCNEKESLLDHTKEQHFNLYISKKVLHSKAAYCFDIVSVDKSYCCCLSLQPQHFNEQLSNSIVCSIHSKKDEDITIQNQRRKTSVNSLCCYPVPPCPLKYYTSCFTRAYGRYIKGAGSVLLENDNIVLLNKQTDQSMKQCLPIQIDTTKSHIVSETNDNYCSKINSIDSTPELFDVKTAEGRLRYFSPSEISRLMGFKTFSSDCIRLSSTQIFDLNNLNQHNATDFKNDEEKIVIQPYQSLLNPVISLHSDNIYDEKNHHSFMRTGEDDFLKIKQFKPHFCLPKPYQPLCTFTDTSHNTENETPCLCRPLIFPSDITVKQRWALLGNSLNPQVVGMLLRDVGLHRFQQ